MDETNETVDPRAFWESRYPAWDLNRHGVDKKAMPLIYRLTRNPPEAIRFRNFVALEHIKEHGRGKRVVELGCGTGRLGPEAVEAGAASYRGIDFARSAVDIAAENAAKAGAADRVTYECADIMAKDLIEADLVFSSGFISWLPDEHIDHMFKITRRAHFLHTITEPRWDFRQIVKHVRQRLTNADPFVVRCFKADAIRAVIRRHRADDVHVLRHKKLYTLAYLSSLPFPAGVRER